MILLSAPFVKNGVPVQEFRVRPGNSGLVRDSISNIAARCGNTDNTVHNSIAGPKGVQHVRWDRHNPDSLETVGRPTHDASHQTSAMEKTRNTAAPGDRRNVVRPTASPVRKSEQPDATTGPVSGCRR